MLTSRLTFQGHDTFLCRTNWLKKGYDFVQADGGFNDADAVVRLGVGKNMVTSIRYWLRAFGLANEGDELLQRDLGKSASFHLERGLQFLAQGGDLEAQRQVADILSRF